MIIEIGKMGMLKKTLLHKNYATTVLKLHLALLKNSKIQSSIQWHPRIDPSTYKKNTLLWVDSKSK